MREQAENDGSVRLDHSSLAPVGLRNRRRLRVGSMVRTAVVVVVMIMAGMGM